MQKTKVQLILLMLLIYVSQSMATDFSMTNLHNPQMGMSNSYQPCHQTQHQPALLKVHTSKIELTQYQSDNCCNKNLPCFMSGSLLFIVFSVADLQLASQRFNSIDYLEQPYLSYYSKSLYRPPIQL